MIGGVTTLALHPPHRLTHRLTFEHGRTGRLVVITLGGGAVVSNISGFSAPCGAGVTTGVLDPHGF